MKPFVFSIVPFCRALISQPKLLYIALRYSIIMGVIEGISLVLLIPAVSALAQNKPVWGLDASSWTIILIVCAILSGGFGYIQMQKSYDTSIDFIKSLHRKIGDQIASLPLGWFNRPVSGQLSRMVSTELMLAGEVIVHLLYPLFTRLTFTVVILAFAWLWDFRFGILLTITLPLYLFFVMVSTSISAKGKAIAEPRELELSDRIVEFTHCQPALRSCARSENYSELTKAADDWRKAKNKELWYEVAGNLIGGVFAQIVVISLIIITAWLTITGSLEPIIAIAFMGLALRYSQVLILISECALGIEMRRPLLDAITEVLSTKPLPQPAKSEELTEPGAIELVDVTFGYDPVIPVLRGVSFKVEPRSMVALVGPSGCGKTTVARLISRFYEVDSGAIKVSGVNVKQLRTEDLMHQLSMVFQDVFLFDDTLKANIVIGNPAATEEEIAEAARLAGVDEIARRLPAGWDTQVGEGGKALSGGERQRVSIARALLKQAPIVLLDEATSALDPENEANVVAAVEKLRETATILVIAHKLDTIHRADAIVQLSAAGEVEDIGTHQELMDRDNTYREFWQRRANSQGWRLT